MFDFGPMDSALLGIFGETVTVRSQGLHGDREITAVYDSRNYEVLEGEASGTDVITTIRIRTEDAPCIRADDVIIARQTHYSVLDIRADPEGMTTLLLGKYKGCLAAEVLP